MDRAGNLKSDESGKINRMGLPGPGGMAVVLVEPENAVNVGFIARTMACYGIADYRIVGSPGIGKLEAARKTGKVALALLDSIRYFDNLPSAIADCHFAFGFTRRIREPAQRLQDLSSAVREWQEGLTVSSQTALVFGRESQGLSREESMAVSQLVSIPMVAEKLSLNISHAVAIALYAFVGSGSTERPNLTTESAGAASPPTQQANAAALEKLLLTLEKRNFFRDGKTAAQREHAKILWQRLRPTQGELEFLSGILNRLSDHA